MIMLMQFMCIDVLYYVHKCMQTVLQYLSCHLTTVTPLLAFFQHTKLQQDKLVKMTMQLYFTELQKAEIPA